MLKNNLFLEKWLRLENVGEVVLTNAENEDATNERRRCNKSIPLSDLQEM